MTPGPREPLLGARGRALAGQFRAWRLASLVFDDDGRIGRRALWLYLAAAMLAAFAVFFSTTLRQMAVVHVGFAVLLLYPSYCVFAKRLQDMGVEGTWAILIVAISALDLVLAASGLKLRPGRLAGLMQAWDWIGLANMAFVFGVLGLWPGNDGANRFGLRQPPW